MHSNIWKLKWTAKICIPSDKGLKICLHYFQIYPLWFRSQGVSLSTSFNWALNLTVSETFLYLIQVLRWNNFGLYNNLQTFFFRYGTWYLYAGCSFVTIIFFSFTLPETKVVIDLFNLIKTFHNLLCCFLGEIIGGHGRFVFKLILEAGQSQIMDICQTMYLFLEKLLIGLTFKYSISIILKTCTKFKTFKYCIIRY